MGDVLSMVYTGNAPSRAGIIEREGPPIQQTSLRFYINGNLGTLDEFVAGLHGHGVIAAFKGSGGMADPMKRFIPHLGKLRKDTKIISGSSPAKLVTRGIAALKKLPDYDLVRLAAGRSHRFESEHYWRTFRGTRCL